MDDRIAGEIGEDLTQLLGVSEHPYVVAAPPKPPCSPIPAASSIGS